MKKFKDIPFYQRRDVLILYTSITAVNGKHNTVYIGAVITCKKDCRRDEFAFLAVTLGGNYAVGVLQSVI